MSKPLGISLGIDFTKIDKDLNAVADKIENLGKAHAIKLGAVAGDVSTGKLAGSDLADTVAGAGAMLASGMAAGIRTASSLMLGFVARIETMLDRLAGGAETIFARIDASMKFPKFDAFFKSAQARLSNFSGIWRKPLSDLDLALSGGFGGQMKALARTLKALFDGLAASITAAMREVLKATGTARTATANAGAGAGGGVGASGASVKQISTAALVARSAVEALRLSTLGLGAALVSVPLRGYIAFSRLGNFLSSLGSVGKKTYSQIYEGHGIVVGSALAATKAVVGLGSAILHIGTLGVFRKGAQEASLFGRAVQKLGAIATSTGGQIVAAFGFIGVAYKLVSFFKDGIKGAADLNETVAVSKGIFGEAFGPVAAQADVISKKFGIMRNEQLRIAAGFGVMAQGAGVTEAASAAMANQLTRLTLDFAKTWEIPFTEAADVIKSGLAGQGRALKQYGVFIDEATTKYVGLAQGARLVGGELTKQSAITARAAIIMNGLSYATGAMERTSGSAAAQFRKAGGGIGEFGVRIGELLLPAIQLATEGFNTLLEATLNVFEAGASVIQSWAQRVTDAMSIVGVVARNLGSVWKIVELQVGAFVENTIAWISVIPANFGPITDWIRSNWRSMLTDLGSMASTAFGNILENATNFGKALVAALRGEGWAFTWKPMLDGFKATTEKLPDLIKPALVNVDAAVGEQMDKIAKVEADRLAAMAKAGAAPKKPGPLGEDKTPDYKLASAVEIGSKEASSIIARNSSGGARNDVARQGLGVAQQQLAELQKLNQKAPQAITVK